MSEKKLPFAHSLRSVALDFLYSSSVDRNRIIDTVRDALHILGCDTKQVAMNYYASFLHGIDAADELINALKGTGVRAEVISATTAEMFFLGYNEIMKNGWEERDLRYLLESGIQEEIDDLQSVCDPDARVNYWYPEFRKVNADLHPSLEKAQSRISELKKYQ